jgi:micrococcal nuclease
MNKRKLAGIVAVCIIAVVVTTVIAMPPGCADNDTTDLVKVIRAIDGDTIEVDIDGSVYKVRYIGIDTPKTVHPSQPVECFGKEASDKNSDLVEGKIVRLEKDVSETDKYGRLLRYVWVGNIFVNDHLVRQGYAYASTYPPDVKYADQFAQAQTEAIENNRGLWAICE